MKKIALVSSLAIFSLSSIAFAVGKPAPIHYLQLFVHNSCNQPIDVAVDDNKGTVYKGNYHFESNKGGQFNLRSSDDEEYYTFTYKNAVCVVNYKIISQPDYSMYATFSDCNSTPHCKISSWPG